MGKSSHLLWRQYRGNRVFVGSGSAGDVFDELFKLAPEKVGTVKEVGGTPAPVLGPACPALQAQGPSPPPSGPLCPGAWVDGRVGRWQTELNWGAAVPCQAIMSFVNQKLERLGLSVQDLDTQVGVQMWVPRQPGATAWEGRRVM